MFGWLTSSSPYLANSNRLADVIAAIQALGTYKFYKLTFEDWADRITGDRSKGPHWRKVFEDHPEFFRLDAKRERASLVLRRQRQKLYHVDDLQMWTREQYLAADDHQKARVSRSPLTPEEIGTLVDVAINLHSRASESARDRRWLFPPLLAFAGALAGTWLSHGH